MSTHSGSSSAGRNWQSIEAAGARALLQGEAPRCRYHVGTSMVQVKLKRSQNTSTAMVLHASQIVAFRCPIAGCVDVSGRTILDEEEE